MVELLPTTHSPVCIQSASKLVMTDHTSPLRRHKLQYQHHMWANLDWCRQLDRQRSLQSSSLWWHRQWEPRAFSMAVRDYHKSRVIPDQFHSWLQWSFVSLFHNINTAAGIDIANRNYPPPFSYIHYGSETLVNLVCKSNKRRGTTNCSLPANQTSLVASINSIS